MDGSGRSRWAQEGEGTTVGVGMRTWTKSCRREMYARTPPRREEHWKAKNRVGGDYLTLTTDGRPHLAAAYICED